MTFTQYTKCITKLLFCVLLLLMPIQRAIAITVDVYTDAKKAIALAGIASALSPNIITIPTASSSIKRAGDYFTDAGKDLVSILATLSQYKTTFPAWETTTDPSTPASADYVTNVTTAENDLKKITALDKLNLDNLEKDNFDNTFAFNNSALQYSQGNGKHKEAFDDGVLCPGKPGLTDITKTYSTLQYKACTIVNNATAYKIKLSESVQKKQTVIDSAVKDILKNSPNTMGNFEARRVALSDLQALQQNVIDEYDLKAKNADLQIKIAEEARLYASEAMLVGPTKKSAKTVALGAFEAAVGIALNNTLPATIPYND
jgi:hypothetical protein